MLQPLVNVDNIKISPEKLDHLNKIASQIDRILKDVYGGVDVIPEIIDDNTGYIDVYAPHYDMAFSVALNFRTFRGNVLDHSGVSHFAQVVSRDRELGHPDINRAFRDNLFVYHFQKDQDAFDKFFAGEDVKDKWVPLRTARGDYVESPGSRRDLLYTMAQDWIDIPPKSPETLEDYMKELSISPESLQSEIIPTLKDLEDKGLDLDDKGATVKVVKTKNWNTYKLILSMDREVYEELLSMIK